ncbi:2-keto-4-pentenoate hydratase [Catellatospora tritici]|uniref:2-keto-4-pentenoate hydratase n=1 Tax=Catellatospora tritici TaxID=2851566 RepID=UPI001C2DD6C6|nr:4-oxalocrotonate decarboxylase [Catellatospora tritici]MBV1854128.1 4-oxalocrotonate decarboxylase [Catellatospora tritici]
MSEERAEKIAKMAELLDDAAVTATAIPQLTKNFSLGVDTAYAVQEALVARRLARGEKLVGLKMGLTSRAKMAQVGVHEVIWGRLTDATAIPDGGTVRTAGFIHPRIEPEVAFLLRGGEIAAVAPALEILDSRYANFEFTHPDVVADNTSAAAYTIGPWCPVPADLANLGVLLEVDGRVARTGSTAAILGDPRRALTEGRRLTARHGVKLQDEWVFLAGAATEAVSLSPGAHVRAVVQGLGFASLKAALA